MVYYASEWCEMETVVGYCEVKTGYVVMRMRMFAQGQVTTPLRGGASVLLERDGASYGDESERYVYACIRMIVRADS